MDLTMRDIAPDPLTIRLLFDNGKQDCERGVDHYEGWQECAKECGFNARQRTPAQEAYLDGYYSGKFGSKKAT